MICIIRITQPSISSAETRLNKSKFSLHCQEDRIDLRAINPSGVFDQVFDCRPERPPSIAESSMWVGEDEPPRKNQVNAQLGGVPRFPVVRN